MVEPMSTGIGNDPIFLHKSFQNGCTEFNVLGYKGKKFMKKL